MIQANQFMSLLIWFPNQKWHELTWLKYHFPFVTFLVTSFKRSTQAWAQIKTDHARTELLDCQKGKLFRPCRNFSNILVRPMQNLLLLPKVKWPLSIFITSHQSPVTILATKGQFEWCGTTKHDLLLCSLSSWSYTPPLIWCEFSHPYSGHSRSSWISYAWLYALLLKIWIYISHECW